MDPLLALNLLAHHFEQHGSCFGRDNLLASGRQGVVPSAKDPARRLNLNWLELRIERQTTRRVNLSPVVGEYHGVELVMQSPLLTLSFDQAVVCHRSKGWRVLQVVDNFRSQALIESSIVVDLVAGLRHLDSAIPLSFNEDAPLLSKHLL